MLKEPIKLTLYDENNEEAATYSCMFIPWGMLKKALSLQAFTANGTENVDESIIDAMGQFVCDLFKNKFTNEDLEKGADLTDVIAVVNAVVGYAGAISPNG